MTKEQLQQLRDLPIEEVAARLGLEVRRHMALCPFHDDHHASLSFHRGRNIYRCFVCGAHGGTIDLVMNLLRKDFHDACLWLAEGEGITPDSSGFSATPSPTKSQHPFDASRYERFFLRPQLSDKARAFLFDERRIDPRVVRWCRLASWCDRQGTEWLQIPYYDRQGHLVGIQNRNLTPGAEPRFRFPRGSRCTIYNLPVISRLHEGEDLWIAEGASDCWAALSSGRKAIAIPSATLLNAKDIEQLEALSRNLGTPFHMAPDRDAPGERLFLQLQEVLPNLTHHQLPPGCKDFADYYVKFNGLTAKD